tara:strand:+ start:168 stop:344 length:177 start_codon:yes stop_codon:yes gene_type:complete
MIRKEKKGPYSYGGKARSSYTMGGSRMEKAEGGKVYNNIRDMEKACMGMDYNESMRQK